MIIPLIEKMSWRNPPLVTIALIFVNCLVFFGIQTGDDDRLRGAWDYYVASDMARVEARYYRQHLEAAGRQKEVAALATLNLDEPETRFKVGQMIEDDAVFVLQLKAGKVVGNRDPLYAKWRSFRNEFDRRLATVISLEYGFRPAFGKLRNAFTCMFLHANFAHLLGNMIFLWLVGCMLEMACPRIVYLLGYLVSGVVSTYTFALFNSATSGPLVGASGAISGMMGAYAMIYGLRKVDVFLMLGFYFDKVKVPAVLLLPFWVAQELYQLFFGGISQVAYLAHVGGLLSGGLMGWGLKKWRGPMSVQTFAQGDVQAEVVAIMEEGLQAFAALDILAARRAMELALAKDKDNRQALVHLFNIEKTEPQGQRFHQSANRLLAVLAGDARAKGELLRYFQEYSRCCGGKKNQLASEVNIAVLTVCCEKGELLEARRLMVHLLQNAPGHELVPGGLLRLAKAYLFQEQHEKGQECLRILCDRYPKANEYEGAVALQRR